MKTCKDPWPLSVETQPFDSITLGFKLRQHRLLHPINSATKHVALNPKTGLPLTPDHTIIFPIKENKNKNKNHQTTRLPITLHEMQNE